MYNVCMCDLFLHDLGGNLHVGGLYLLPPTPRWGVCIFSLSLPGGGSVSFPSHSQVGGLYHLPPTPRWGVCIFSLSLPGEGSVYLLPSTPRWGVCIFSLPLPGGGSVSSPSHSQVGGRSPTPRKRAQLMSLSHSMVGVGLYTANLHSSRGSMEFRGYLVKL